MEATSYVCPRCGGTIYLREGVAPSGVPTTLQCLGCSVSWASERSLEYEITARELAGTKAAFIDAEYLRDNHMDGQLYLRDELEELASLAQLAAYQEVLKALDLAIELRDSATYRKTGSAAKINVELNVLQGMRNWLLEKMDEYGATNGSV